MQQNPSVATEEGSTGRALRSARMAVSAAALISADGQCRASEVTDISATGVMIERPDQWCGRIGDLFVLDMLFGDHVDIHVEARLVRVEGRRLAFAFAEIADDRQSALWSLLGCYADSWQS